MQTRNVFAGPYLDRGAHLRQDGTWFSSALADANSRVIPVWNSRSLVTGEGPARAAFLALGDIPPARRGLDDLILLGRTDRGSVFAYEIGSLDQPAVPDGTRFEDLRFIASLMPSDDAGLLGYARAMILWRQRHRFCGTCGTKTLPSKGGHVLVCTNATCRHEQFPRLDPAIIVLVSDGERALLGRQASWPPGRYSTIAGFVEPGESLEDAVGREVLEETGVQVDGIEYHSSQPWPFPASLMLGFTATATTLDILRRDDELEDARWPRQSISYSLIEHWFDAGSDRPLRDVSLPSLPMPRP